MYLVAKWFENWKIEIRIPVAVDSVIGIVRSMASYKMIIVGRLKETK